MDPPCDHGPAPGLATPGARCQPSNLVVTEPCKCMLFLRYSPDTCQMARRSQPTGKSREEFWAFRAARPYDSSGAGRRRACKNIGIDRLSHVLALLHLGMKSPRGPGGSATWTCNTNPHGPTRCDGNGATRSPISRRPAHCFFADLASTTSETMGTPIQTGNPGRYDRLHIPLTEIPRNLRPPNIGFPSAVLDDSSGEGALHFTPNNCP